MATHSSMPALGIPWTEKPGGATVCGAQESDTRELTEHARTHQQFHSWEYMQIKLLTQKDTCTPMFIAALFTVAKAGKPLKCPLIDEWIKEMWYIWNAYSGMLLSHKKE